MKIKSPIALALTLSLAPIQSMALINGKLAEPQSYASQSTVMVLQKHFRKTGRGQCTGTLIAPTLVLTAAHCVVDFSTGNDHPASDLTIYFGNYDGENWVEHLARQGRNLVRHKDYIIKGQEISPTKKVHDIALIRLNAAAPTEFKPAPMLLNLEELSTEHELLLAGYGNIFFMGDKREPRSRILRTFETSVKTAVHPISGQMEYARPEVIRTIEDYQKYIGGMAGGDSGGPAYAVIKGTAYVVGIASGYRYNEQPFYESVPAHKDWIEENSRKLY
ncbi:MAG: trypsin-like serine protease [Oligoflexia bacterium]|nr:trypsin-like serine protease [Oligoflexia bacterium]